MIFWRICQIINLLYLLAIIPIALGFDLCRNGLSTFINLFEISLGFQCLEIVININTDYFEEGTPI